MRQVPRRRVLASVSFAVLLMFARPAAAQNLLTNPHFDVDLSGWTLSPATTFDGTADANGSPTSGSARTVVTMTPFTNQFAGVLSPCITGITALATYDFGGKIFLDSAPAGAGGEITIAYYSDNACATPIIADLAPPVTTTGSWVSTSKSSLAPVSAVAVRFTTNGGTAATGGDIVFHIDDVFFQAAGSVPAMGTTLNVLLAVSLLIGSGLLLRRRAAV